MTKTGRQTERVKLENFCKFCHRIIIGSSYKFKSHLFMHNAVQAKYNCDLCLKKFYRKDAYQNHVSRHKGTVAQKSNYTCAYCDRSFVLRNTLIAHLNRIHDENLNSELGKHSCSICDITYCERRLLDQHIRRVHFNIRLCKEPLHTNKFINETWIENVNNKNATVSITKVNNNVIVIKKLKFETKVNETKPHIIDFKLENDQYSRGICEYCKKEMIKKSLRTHIKEVHMNIRKFKCKVCKETFSRHYQLVDHKCGQFKSYKKHYIYKKKDLKNHSDSKLLVSKKEF